MQVISRLCFEPQCVQKKKDTVSFWLTIVMANMRVFIFTTLQDLRYFKSDKTSRGILQEGWRDTQDPIMCSYKLVTVKFEVWGLQTRVEQFVHKVRACP